MMAELYGKATGTCKGKGGSMHIADLSTGMLGANGIVGGGPPLVCGVGLSAKVRGTDQVGVSFTGDGGSNQGTFLESLNFAAAIHGQPPVRFSFRGTRPATGEQTLTLHATPDAGDGLYLEVRSADGNATMTATAHW